MFTSPGIELTDTPVALLELGQVAKVPMLFGTNRDEGSTFTGNQTGNGAYRWGRGRGRAQEGG